MWERHGTRNNAGRGAVRRGAFALVAAVFVALAAGLFFSSGGQPDSASADTGFPATISVAQYQNGVLTISGTGTFTACPSNSKGVGFAIFADGATPVSPGSGALDGVGAPNTMHPANMTNYVYPCQSPYTWGPDNHTLATPPNTVCVVIYDVHSDKLPPDTGNHSTVGAGANRNEDNSYEKNGNTFEASACKAVTIITPTPTPTPSPTPTPTPPPNTDLTVDKTGPATALPGNQIAYNILVSNIGGSPAQSVTAVDTLPAGTTFVSATPSQGSCNFTSCNLGTIGVGGNATISVVVQVNAGSSGTLVNTVCVSTPTPETTTANNCDTTTTTIPTPTPPPPGTDITVDKLGPGTALPGNQITYNITVSNIGSSAAQNVFALDNLPAGTTFVSATPSQGSCAFVSCSLGTLNAGASATITIVVQVNPGASGTLTNTVCVSTTTAETNTSNNCDTTTTTIPTPTPTPPVVTPTPTPPIITPTPPVMTPTPTPPVITPTPPPAIVDISVTKTDIPDPVFAGANLTYLIVVTNHGPATAAAVVAVDNLPAGVTFISATPSQGSCSFVSCSLGSLAPGATATITIIVRVNSGTTGTLTNTVCVSTATNEPNLSNNCATVTTNVLTPTPTPSPSPTPSPTPPGQTPSPTPPGTPTPPPGPRSNINLVKVDSPDPVVAGGTLTYGISVTNAGPDTATNVVVTDALPSGVTLISATPSQGTCNGTTCALGDIAAGDSVAIAFVVTVDASVSGDIENIACAATSTQDPDLSDNCDDETTTVTPPGGSPTPTALPIVSPPAGPGGLPPTGGFFDAGSLGSWLMLALGAALLIGGSTAVIVSRRSKETF